MQKEKKTEQERMLEMFAELLKTKAEQYKVTARLWETNPEEFGTDINGITEWKGMSRGYEYALRDFKEFMLGETK